VLKQHLGARACIAPSPSRTALSERRHSEEATRKLLAEAPEGSYIYQATLRPPPAFYEQMGIDPSLVQLRDNHPDLIAVTRSPEGQRLLQVIDVKAGEVLHIPSNIWHRAEALEDTLDVDVFSPPREDWLNHTDSYFHKK